MTTLSINLPNTLARESRIIASELGISRTQFIRQAIIHELEHFKIQREQKAIIESFKAMKKDKSYLVDAEELTDKFNSDLPNDGEEWWKKKSKKSKK